MNEAEAFLNWIVDCWKGGAYVDVWVRPRSKWRHLAAKKGRSYYVNGRRVKAFDFEGQLRRAKAISWVGVHGSINTLAR